MTTTTAAGRESTIEIITRETTTSDVRPSSLSAGSAVSEVVRILTSTDHTNSTEFSNSTVAGVVNSENEKGSLPRWQIILIAALSSAFVVIVIALVLIWKLCGKKVNEEASSTEKPNSCRCCPGSLSKKKASGPSVGETSVGFRPTSAHKPPLTGEYQQDPNGQERNLESRAPLPPISGNANSFPVDHNAALQGATVMPRRLAPLGGGQPNKTMATTNLAGGTITQTTRRTGGVYAPLQQHQQQQLLKGVPMIPVPLEQRRPLPPPPPPPE